VVGGCHVAAEYFDTANLDPLCASNNAKQRGLTDAIRTDLSNDAARRNFQANCVKRTHTAILVSETFEAGNRVLESARLYDCPCSRFGHAILGSNFT